MELYKKSYPGKVFWSHRHQQKFILWSYPIMHIIEKIKKVRLKTIVEIFWAHLETELEPVFLVLRV